VAASEQENALAAVVLAGGLGTRMRSATAKHFHPILGRRLVDWVIAAARGAHPERPAGVAAADWLRWEQEKHSKLLSDAGRPLTLATTESA